MVQKTTQMCSSSATLSTGEFNHATPTRQSTVIFVHIPKTAGTSLHTTMTVQYGHGRSYWFGKQQGEAEAKQHFAELSVENRKKLRLIRGHIPFGWHEHVPGPFTYISLLRDPVDRVISLYFYGLKAVGTLWHEQATAAGSLRNYIESGVTLLTDNAQVRQLSGSSPPFGQVTQETLDLAKKNVEQYFCLVGMQSRFDESLTLMHRILRWRYPLFYLRGMVNKKRPKLSEVTHADRQCIEERNALDRALYEWVAKRLDQQIASRQSQVKRDVQRLHRNNAMASVLVKRPLALYRKIRSKQL